MPNALWIMVDTIGWETIAVAAALALLAVLAVRRTHSRLLSIALRVAAAAAVVIATFGYANFSAERDRAAERRAFALRQDDLAARAMAPGSPLACLDGDAGETVENACEKAIFAKPDTTAAAVSYMSARLTLLADARRLAPQGDPQFTARLAGIRHALMLDRYGIAAHVLADRDGCTPDVCAAFALIDDPAVLKANLKARAFDAYVERYAVAWNKTDDRGNKQDKSQDKPPMDAPQASAAPPGQPAVPFASRYDFPSSASIPPVSIMNAEPPRSPEAGGEPPAVAAAPEPGAATPLPPKRPRASAPPANPG